MSINNPILEKMSYTYLSREFLKERNQEFEKHVRKDTFCIRDMKIKTTLRFDLILFRMVKTNKTNDSILSKSKFTYYLCEWKLLQPCWNH